jgi:hypothetical protein
MAEPELDENGIVKNIKARRIRFSRKDNGRIGPFTGAQFDVEAFLAQPLVGRLALEGPTVRPIFYVWEQECFWMITGAWSILDKRFAVNPEFELVLDIADLDTGITRQVIAHGFGSIVDFDVERGRRILTRYNGPDEDYWDPRFQLKPDPSIYGTRLARLEPQDIWTVDLSFRTAADARARAERAALAAD